MRRVRPIIRELELPTGISPLDAFRVLAEGDAPAALLEHAAGPLGEDGAISIVVPRAARVLCGDGALEAARDHVADEVDACGVELPPFVGGVVGMLGHEYVTVLEPRVKRATGPHPVPTPSALLLVVDECVVYDHARSRTYAVRCVEVDAAGIAPAAVVDRANRRLDYSIVEALGRCEPTGASCASEAVDEPSRVEANMSRADFLDRVERARAAILAGECVQVVISQRFDRPGHVDPLAAYRALRAYAPAPHHALVRIDGERHLVLASPEQLVGVRGGRLVTHPIAGTRPRSGCPVEDDRRGRELAADPKEQAEHVMLVDLGRNDLARVARPGSVRVTALARIEPHAGVLHLVSRVEAELRAGLHPVDALASCFPAGTLSGAPKVRALELVAELEPDERGPYGGVVGYVGHGGVLDVAITIRSILLGPDRASIQAGAGVVAQSVPQREYDETRAKAARALAALDVAAAAGAASLRQAEAVA